MISLPSMACSASAIRKGKYCRALISRVTEVDSLKVFPVASSPRIFFRYCETGMKAPLSLSATSHFRFSR
jgi:hypothetical protein